MTAKAIRHERGLARVMRARVKRALSITACAMLSLLVGYGSASALEVFAAGMLTPETISKVPDGFGTHGGDFFVPDFARGVPGGPIWDVPAGGGAPSVFATNPNSILLGGLFLPGNWGSNAGKFLTTGFDASVTGKIFTYDATGTATQFLSIPNVGYTTPLIAPSGFGGFGGDLIATDQQNGNVEAIAPDGTRTVLAGLTPFLSPSGFAFGEVFAPSGFGGLGGKLLVSSGGSGQIFSVAADGAVTPFTTTPLAPGQIGLRQMAFSPAGFLEGFGELLFVSVSGSRFGGGTLGDVLALDAGGDIVASLRFTTDITKFDPRGLLFLEDGSLLISDASDPIRRATRADFQRRAVAEPGTLLLVGSGLVGIAAWRRQRQLK